MSHELKQSKIRLAVSCALMLGFATTALHAEIDPAETGYLTDSRGQAVRSGSGLCWHTGTRPAVATVECDGSPAPAPLAQVAAPAVKPTVVAAAPPAARAVQRITLDADTLFDFDKATLRPAGQAALDDFVVRLGDINPEVINAVGHTDRFGSEAYNQRLSEQRVAAVRTYLVGKGIESSRIHTEGKGETQPVTQGGECDGAKSKKVIACLQPDRRVDVEVVGNRVDKLTQR